LFPKSFNVFPTVAAIAGLCVAGSAIGGFWYYATPKFFEVGYQPKQPGDPGSEVGFPHHLHAGKLGMDCRYCHTKVETSYEANIPNVATCYGCHSENKLKTWSTQRVKFVREAYAKDESIVWRRVHKVPDYVHNFPHHVHVNAGVSCYSCHGQITAMPYVYQAQPLGMGWCLECHRNPEANLVPKDMVTNLVAVQDMLAKRVSGEPVMYGGQQKNSADLAKQLVDSLEKAPPQNCGACHY
jgi:hypothetical protein